MSNYNVKTFIVGSGGHCRVIIDCLEKNNILINGIIDISFKRQTKKEYIHNYEVIGGLKKLNSYNFKHTNIYLAIGNNELRKKIYEKLKKKNFNFPFLIHPNSIISKKITLKKGVFVNAGAIVNAGVTLSDFSIINTGAIVDHQTKIGAFSHISPGCILAGKVRVGELSFIGVGVNIIDNVSICKNNIIGASSLVISSIKKSGTYIGIPAKKIK